MIEEKTEASAAFLRTRADHAIEILEDYTEAIAKISKENGKCRVMDLARYFGVSHVSVIQVLQRLLIILLKPVLISRYTLPKKAVP